MRFGAENNLMRFMQKEKEYRKMILANIISRFGDSIDAIAYAWMVYELTGSKSWLAVILGINAIPAILFQPFSGALVEFFDRKKTAVLCDFGRGILVFLTGILMIYGLLLPWHLIVLTFLNSSLESLRIPAGISILPHILRKENYIRGLSYSQVASHISELTGTAAAGIIIGLLGTGGALLIDAATFLASALLLSRIRLSGDHQRADSLTMVNYINDLKSGFSYFKRSHILFLMCTISILINISIMPIKNLQAAYVNESLALSVLAMSVGSTAMTIGLLLGTLLFPRFSRQMSCGGVLIGGWILIGALYFAFTLTGALPGSIIRYISYAVCAFFFGLINAFLDMAVTVVFFSSTPKEYLGRVSSIFNAVANSTIPIASFIIAGFFSVLSINALYLIMGSLTLLACLGFNRNKSVKELKDIHF